MPSSMWPHNLSLREVEVIELIAKGLTDKEIAARLHIVPRTVAEHINNIRAKLGASNRASAVYLYFFEALAHRQEPVRTASNRSDMTYSNNGAQLRAAVAQSDLDAITAICYADRHAKEGCEFLTPATPAGVRDDLALAFKDAKHRFMVAEQQSGDVAGFAQLSHYPWLPPDVRSVTVAVDAAQRGTGIYGMLLDDAIAYCADQKLVQISIGALDTDADLLRAARERGFVEDFHRISLELDLHAFGSGRFADVVERVRASRIRISNMAEQGNTEEAQRKLFYLNSWCATLDLPGVKDQPAWDTWEQFHQSVCQSWWYQPEGQIVAIDEQTGEWIGMCAVTANARQPGADVMHTGVDRRYRRDPRIGQALKLTAIRYCIAKGAHKLGDNHDSRDSTNLALNYSLGFSMLPGVIHLDKHL